MTSLLSFLLFWLLLTIGQILKSKGIGRERISADEFWLTNVRPSSISIFLPFVLYIISALIELDYTPFKTIWSTLGLPYAGPLSMIGLSGYRWFKLLGLLAAIVMLCLLVFAKYKFHILVSSVLMLLFFAIIAFGPLVTEDRFSDIENYTLPYLGLLFPLGFGLTAVLLFIASAKAVSRRLIFLALGLLLLIGLNELSRLGIDVTAPKQG
jgi:hypothetical protein